MRCWMLLSIVADLMKSWFRRWLRKRSSFWAIRKKGKSHLRRHIPLYHHSCMITFFSDLTPRGKISRRGMISPADVPSASNSAGLTGYFWHATNKPEYDVSFIHRIINFVTVKAC